ncbi:MAG: hypothetical protein IKZ98_03860 [Clostridia bacterium]|nr:hypothetical protein [Clostridia bacterium]
MKFNKGIKRYVKMLAFVLMLSVAFSAQADSSYISIQELREKTPSTWTETLKGGKKNFDCTVDASIVVPEVEQFPILEISYQGIVPGLEETGFYIEDNTEYGMMVVSTSEDVSKGIDYKNEIVLRNDSLSEQEINRADEKARAILSKIWDMNGTNLEMLGITEYKATKNDYVHILVDFCPTYDGIAYLTYPNPAYVIKDYTIPPLNTAYVFWREDIEYEGAFVYVPRLIGEYVQDVPLLPFSEIQDIICQRMQEGYIQSICEIRLGYISGNNPECPDKDFYLTPAWVVCGVINPEPNIPFYPDEYHHESRYQSSLVINAQTGEVVDFNSRSKEAFEAHILTWDDVKK